MIEKHFFNNNKSNYIINLSQKKPILCSKVKKKMKNYKMTNFNFILDDKSIEIIDDNIISEKTNSEEDKKNQELSTTENDKNKQILIEKKNNNNNIYENIINISEDENSQNDNNFEIISDSQSNSNDIFLNKQCDNIYNSNYQLKNENENEHEEFFPVKGEYKKRGGSQPLFTGINEYFGNFSNNIKILNEDIRDNSADNIYLGKKIKKSDEKVDFGTQTYDYDTIFNNKEINKSKVIILKLIEKYSYQFIFNLFLKFCSINMPEIDNEYDKEVDIQILKLIKELGIEKVMKIILSIGNSREEYIKYYLNENDSIKVKEDQLYDNDINNNVYNLNEYNENIIEDNNNNNIIDLSDDEEIDNKKDIKDNDNNIDNKDIDKDNKDIDKDNKVIDKDNNNSIIDINEDSDEEIEQNENNKNLNDNIDNYGNIINDNEDIKDKLFELLDSSDTTNMKNEIYNLFNKK